MLRLGQGLSAEKLSQEYATGGTGALTRTTIAKIEGEKRKIKAGEVEGVARVFDLTSTDLLDPEGPAVFLSYADKDVLAGQEVSEWLGDHGFQVLPPGDARVIDAADAFVALLSPSFLASPRCQDELSLAVQREQRLLSSGGAARLIHVLRVADVPDLDDFRPSSQGLIDLPPASERSREVALSKLGTGIIGGTRAPAAPTVPQVHVRTGEEYLDRGEELERVLYALSNQADARFWLVTGPPGLGKSWFLEQLKARAAEPASGDWITSMVDLHAGERAGRDAAGTRPDATSVVVRLFGLDHPQSSDLDDDLRGVAQRIIRDDRPWLCLLDGADLLSAAAVTQLRQHLGKIYRLIQNAGSSRNRLGLVVASRRAGGWGGMTPSPRVSALRLAGLGPSAVQSALEGLARRMPGVHSPAELRRDAALVQRVTEGVPELVLATLRWIQAEEWLEIERLTKTEFFVNIIAPYVEDRLLVKDSLDTGEEGELAMPARQLSALKDSLRVLAPYRFITLSHVRHHMQNDFAFRDALKEANWSPEDLWQAIGGVGLLLTPLAEPWLELQPAIRRLLYRYFYPPDERAAVHARARDFTKEWAGQLTGKDQVNGIVESIWHEAVRLRLKNNSMLENELPRFARALSGGIRESAAYSTAELRDYAIQRIEVDDELQREVADAGDLLDTLISVIKDPGAQGEMA